MDKRKLNGGHSTKAKGIDKRKNAYRKALEEASTPEDITEVIMKLKKMAKSEDLQAIKLYLEYYLGKPKEIVETNLTLNNLTLSDLVKFGDAKS